MKKSIVNVYAATSILRQGYETDALEHTNLVPVFLLYCRGISGCRSRISRIYNPMIRMVSHCRIVMHLFMRHTMSHAAMPHATSKVLCTHHEHTAGKDCTEQDNHYRKPTYSKKNIFHNLAFCFSMIYMLMLHCVWIGANKNPFGFEIYHNHLTLMHDVEYSI